jgi:hypothetical protein
MLNVIRNSHKKYTMISALSGLVYRLHDPEYPQFPSEDEVMLCFVEGNFICKRSLLEGLPFFNQPISSGISLTRTFHFEEPILVQISYAFLYSKVKDQPSSTFSTTITFDDLKAVIAILIEKKTIYDVFSIETLENPVFFEHLMTVLVYFGNIQSRQRLIELKQRDATYMPYDLAKKLSACLEHPSISMVPEAQAIMAKSLCFETEQQAKEQFDQIHKHYLESCRVEALIEEETKGDPLQKQRNELLRKFSIQITIQLSNLRNQFSLLKFQANISKHISHPNPQVKELAEEAIKNLADYRKEAKGCFKASDSEEILNYLIGPAGFILEEFNISCSDNILRLPNNEILVLTLDHHGPYYLWRDLQTYFKIRELKVPEGNPYEPKILWRKQPVQKPEWIECLLNWGALSEAQKDQKVKEILQFSNWAIYFISHKDIEFSDIQTIEGIRYLRGRHKVVDKPIYFDLEDFKLYFYSPNNLLSHHHLKVMQQVNASF